MRFEDSSHPTVWSPLFESFCGRGAGEPVFPKRSRWMCVSWYEKSRPWSILSGDAAMPGTRLPGVAALSGSEPEARSTLM